MRAENFQILEKFQNFRFERGRRGLTYRTTARVNFHFRHFGSVSVVGPGAMTLIVLLEQVGRRQRALQI